MPTSPSTPETAEPLLQAALPAMLAREPLVDPLAAYLGSTLRYDVETLAGIVLKVDVGDPWQHEVLPAGHGVRVTFPASATLVLRDD